MTNRTTCRGTRAIGRGTRGARRSFDGGEHIGPDRWEVGIEEFALWNNDEIEARRQTTPS